MAAITNTQAVAFANQKIRPMADAMAQSYFTAKAIVAAWNATGMSSLITNTADNIVDGSASDGRNPITGAQATSIITRAMEIVADYEAGSNAKLNTVMIPAVNSAGKF